MFLNCIITIIISSTSISISINVIIIIGVIVNTGSKMMAVVQLHILSPCSREVPLWMEMHGLIAILHICCCNF